MKESGDKLPRGAGFSLRLQAALGMLAVGIVAPLYFLFLRWRGYRVRDLAATRRRWAELRREHPGPWLICGNHLTLIDSALITYALMSLGSHFTEFRAIPWNLPERANFQGSSGKRRSAIWRNASPSAAAEIGGRCRPPWRDAVRSWRGGNRS